MPERLPIGDALHDTRRLRDDAAQRTTAPERRGVVFRDSRHAFVGRPGASGVVLAEANAEIDIWTREIRMRDDGVTIRGRWRSVERPARHAGRTASAYTERVTSSDFRRARYCRSGIVRRRSPSDPADPTRTGRLLQQRLFALRLRSLRRSTRALSRRAGRMGSAPRAAPASRVSRMAARRRTGGCVVFASSARACAAIPVSLTRPHAAADAAARASPIAPRTRAGRPSARTSTS